MSKSLSLALLATLALLLSACSREPNQQELQQLYEAQVQQTNQLASKIMQHKSEIMRVKSFEKIDCQKTKESKDYHCRANVTVDMPFLGEQTSTAKLQVTRGEQGWIIID